MGQRKRKTENVAEKSSRRSASRSRWLSSLFVTSSDMADEVTPVSRAYRDVVAAQTVLIEWFYKYAPKAIRFSNALRTQKPLAWSPRSMGTLLITR
jgi:hypothetical protein